MKNRILNIKVCLFIVISFSLILSSVNSTGINSCKLKMATNRMAFAKSEKLIFNEGVLDPNNFSQNSVDAHVTSSDNLIEYFYIFEDKLVNKHEKHDTIKTLTISDDLNILTVQSEVSSGGSEFKEGFDLSEIEVKYSCIHGKKGKVKVSMLVTSDQCDPFTIYWYKECNSTSLSSNISSSSPAITDVSKNKILSSLNIGIYHKGDDIFKDGKFVEKGSDLSLAISIPANIPTITLYFSTKPGNVILMNEVDFILNQENLVPILRGELRKGGIITDTQQSLIIAMACTNLKISKTDIQLKLLFEQDQKLNIFFNKECDTTTEIQEYFSILSFIYWVFLILIVIFLISVFIYYLNKNEMTIIDLIDRVKEYGYYFIDKYLNMKKFNSLSNQIEKQSELTESNENLRIRKEKLFIEDDHLDNDEPIDIKISSESENKEKLSKNTNSISMDYGGI